MGRQLGYPSGGLTVRPMGSPSSHPTRPEWPPSKNEIEFFLANFRFCPLAPVGLPDGLPDGPPDGPVRPTCGLTARPTGGLTVRPMGGPSSHPTGPEWPPSKNKIEIF